MGIGPLSKKKIGVKGIKRSYVYVCVNVYVPLVAINLNAFADA